MANPTTKDVDSLVTILTLGDGDFTYSLDLVNYYASFFQLGGEEICPNHQGSVEVTATSFDSLATLRSKYKDIDSILKRLRSVGMDRRMLPSLCSEVEISDAKKRRKIDNTKPQLVVDIFHDINAIVSPADGKSCAAIPSAGYDHVIFNHPHLGKEDAELHGMFVSHLFHSCDTTWLKTPRGLLHLTLLLGQCERWRVISRANDHGLELLRRKPFTPPPAAGGSKNCYYVLRRHQSGKSFSSKRLQCSETLTFGRKQVVWSTEESAFELPWYTDAQLCDRSSPTEKECLEKEFKCQYCTKSFTEKRSLKSHLAAIHLGADGNLVTMATEYYNCEICKIRSFPTKSALQDHLRARHTLHADIKPDWYVPMRHSQEDVITKQSQTTHKSLQNQPYECEICKATYSDRFGPMEHYRLFAPVNEREGEAGKLLFQCLYCGKTFRDNRARLQHENFCIITTDDVITDDT